MPKKRTLVVCPGRGSYNNAELGYLSKKHAHQKDLLKDFDQMRVLGGQEAITELDAAKNFTAKDHLRGDNASGLIYACSIADFQSIDLETHEIVAVTGNSMGWYSALACAGALTFEDGFFLCNTMARIMQDGLIGGQLLHPFVDKNWLEIPGQRQRLQNYCQQVENLFISIEFGGMFVFAGDQKALNFLDNQLERVGTRFPLQLVGHGGFHSPLQQPNSIKGFEAIPSDIFRSPDIPLVDGRGNIWYPQVSDPEKIREYTLGSQVLNIYDFTKAIQNCLVEFAPDVIIALGPGNSLDTAIGQILVQNRWDGICTKQDFEERQSPEAILQSMGAP